MLRLLMYLAALSLLETGAAHGVRGSGVVNIRKCPVTFFGQRYHQLFVNFTSNTVAMCFNSYFKPGAAGDCIVAPRLFAKTLRVRSVRPRIIRLSPRVRRIFPKFLSRRACRTQLIFGRWRRTELFLELYNFRRRAVLRLTSKVWRRRSFLKVNLLVNGKRIRRIKLSKRRARRRNFFDISGCRFSGVFFPRGSKTRFCSNTCKKIICTKAAVLRVLRSNPPKPCRGKRCQAGSVCTLIGPAVVDVRGRLRSIRDRCTYQLLVPSSSPDFQVLGNFQERRRKDVVFLERLILKRDKPDVLIHLEQSGRVLVGGAEAALGSTPQLFHGVMLSKNESGVTAEASLSNGVVTVFFNGITAQIHTTEPGPVRGVCAGSSRRLSDLSDVGCRRRHHEGADRTIDCMKMTERCSLLKGAPFTACKNHIDPAPFITACTNMMCKYPAVDGLSHCQFLEAYANVCRLRGPALLEGWRSKVNCSAPQIFCPHRICSAHEFCGETVEDGGTRCYCRAVFAATHRPSQRKVVCTGDSASVTLPVCVLEAKGIDPSTLHLKDQTCKGQVDDTTHTVTFSFNSTNTCGTVVTANSSHIIYRNAIMDQNTTDAIVRQRQVLIDFCCFTRQPGLESVAIVFKDSSVIRHLKAGGWRYTLTMKAYVDAARTRAIDSAARICLNQRVWVGLKADGLDNNFLALVAESCWATNEPQPNASLRHDLIMNGCADRADGTVNVEANGLGSSAYFSFKAFRFSGKSRKVFLHCKFHLCIKKTATSCNPRCTGLVRLARSARTDDGDGNIITMAWTH